MKKINILFLASLFLISCGSEPFSSIDISEYQKENDENNGSYAYEYFLYTASIDEYSLCNGGFEKYFGINDEESIIIENKDDYDAFLALIDNCTKQISYSAYTDINNKDFDLDNYNLAISAAYVDNSVAFFNVSSITTNETNIIQTITCNITTPSVAQSTFSFLYTLLPKNETKTIENIYLTVNNYDQNLCYKPIIYFYPLEEMDLSIKYLKEDNLLTTYPKYDNGWNIHLDKDGNITTNNSNRSYYALYFDEKANYLTDFKEGFYVNKDNAISFLEEKLDYIGYNYKEANEFIMYWLPILKENEHSLVYFEQTELRNQNCPLEFSNAPDTLIRTIIHIKKIDSKQNIKEQELVSYQRNGFTITEWGGIVY